VAKFSEEYPELRMSEASLAPLVSEFSKLVNEEHGEQTYQAFLEAHPQFIPRLFIQNHGLHHDLIFSKLSIGSEYKTEFCYLAKSSCDWNCVLIEIEKPSSKYFKAKNEFHADFNHALGQIERWRMWFESSENRNYFTNEILGPVRYPLDGNPCSIKYVLVHGRRSEYEGNNVRMGLRRTQKRDDVMILSYDSLIEGAKNNDDAYICSKKNEFVDIISKHFVTDSAFIWLGSRGLRVNRELREDFENAIKKVKSRCVYPKMEDLLKRLTSISD